MSKTRIITTQSGETVEIKVSEISEGRVKLGIDAEKSIAVLRKEVVEAAKDENRESIQKVQLDKEKLKNVIKL